MNKKGEFSLIGLLLEIAFLLIVVGLFISCSMKKETKFCEEEGFETPKLDWRDEVEEGYLMCCNTVYIEHTKHNDNCSIFEYKDV